MVKYKLLTKKGYASSKFEFGGIYDENYIGEVYKVSHLAKAFPKDWQLVKEYTLKELVGNSDVVVYLDSKEEWEKLKKTKLFNMTKYYSGSHCYSFTSGTFSSSSSKNDPGGYDKTVEIITIDQIIFEEKFVLPKDWYIEVPNEEDCKEFQDYFECGDSPATSGTWFYLSRKVNISNAKTYRDDIPKDFQKITIEQFRKYVLMKETKELTFPRKMLVWNHDEKNAGIVSIYAHIPALEQPWIGNSDRWKYAKELPQKYLPSISGYKGEKIDNDTVKYGCTKADIGHLQDLYNSSQSFSKDCHVDSIKLSNGTTVTMAQIKQIIDYYEESSN